MTSETLKLLTRDGLRSEAGTDFTFILKDDGSLEYHSADEFNDGKLWYVTADGTWRLKHDASYGNQVVKNLIELEIADDGRSYSQTFGFARVDGSLVLWKFHGDPDLWEFIEYRQER
jgi:hypothetical protein